MRKGGIPLVLTSVLLAGCSASEGAHSSGLTAIQMGHPQPAWLTWIHGRHSTVMSTYDDGGDTWSVYLRYRGCPVTREGAVRVTVYENAYRRDSVGQGSYVPDLSKQPHPYSRTAVDYHPSDDVLYTWPAHRESSWQVHIDIPAKQGCRIWRYGGETN